VEEIWVLAEQCDGVPAGIVLKLLTAARGFGRVVGAVTWGPGSESASMTLGHDGATKVYDLRDIGQSLPGPKVATAIAAHV
jgi:electron transfer flavoprotein alpha subunit